jgi:hypothetical protein
VYVNITSRAIKAEAGFKIDVPNSLTMTMAKHWDYLTPGYERPLCGDRFLAMNYRFC